MDLEYGHFEAIAIVTDSGIHKAKTSSWESDKSEKVTRHVLITEGKVDPPSASSGDSTTTHRHQNPWMFKSHIGNDQDL